MPFQTPSASDYTNMVKGSAQVSIAAANASSGITAKRVSGSVPLASGVLSAARSVVTRSRVSQTSGLQPFTARTTTSTSTAAPRNASVSITGGTGGDGNGVVAQYSTSGEIVSGIFLGGFRSVVTADSLGNIYMLCHQTGGNVKNLNGTTSSVAALTSCRMMLVKYSPTGMVTWTAGINALTPIALKCDADNNVYALCRLEPSIGYQSVGGSFVGTNNESGNGFCMFKFNSSGIFQWRVYAPSGTTSGLEDVGGLAIDSSGNVYITYFIRQFNAASPMSFRNSDETTFSPSVTYNSIVVLFLLKYNSTGTLQWFVHFNHDNSFYQSHGASLAIDSLGNVYVGGGGTGTMTICKNNVSTGTSYTSVGNRPCILAKFNSDGVPQWMVSFDNGDYGVVHAIAIDSNNDVYATGVYRGSSSPSTLTFNTTSGATKTITSSNGTGFNESFVVKYSSAGVPQWASRIGTPTSSSPANAYVYALDMARDSTTGDMYIVGWYNANTVVVYDMNAGAFVTTITGSTSQTEGFLVKYSSSGTPLLITSMKGTGTEEFVSITLTNNKLYVGGRMTSTSAIVYSSL